MRCLRCGRPLSKSLSLKRGMGDVCWKKINSGERLQGGENVEYEILDMRRIASGRGMLYLIKVYVGKRVSLTEVKIFPGNEGIVVILEDKIDKLKAQKGEIKTSTTNQIEHVAEIIYRKVCKGYRHVSFIDKDDEYYDLVKFYRNKGKLYHPEWERITKEDVENLIANPDNASKFHSFKAEHTPVIGENLAYSGLLKSLWE